MAPRRERRDLFEEAYTVGLGGPPKPRRRRARRVQPSGPPLAHAAPAEPFALHGAVLTPERALKSGYVVVGRGKDISAVQSRKPQGVRIHETGGVVLPGLIDLHGHPEFNVFAAWEPPKQFVNRYAWRGSAVYRRLVREPQNVLIKALPQQTQLRYAEIRALVGGVTAIQGTSEDVRVMEEEALVRNVDRLVFGRRPGRAMIDLPSEGGRDMSRLRQILADVRSGDAKAFYLHLAEGRGDNPRSVQEFQRMVDLGALTPATVIIHGTALSRAHFDDMAQVGAKLVWSPQSNLRLYGETTQAADALAAGLLVGLGADWLPSGSTSLLAEMKVARRSLAAQGWRDDPERLVRMVTADAARIAGLDDRLGTLKPGYAADILVLERREEDPWEDVLEADPSWVELVMVDGDLTYGRADWMTALSDPADQDRLEPVIAWGKPMLIDTGYTAQPSAAVPPRLAELRAALIGKYPAVGPVFA